MRPLLLTALVVACVGCSTTDPAPDGALHVLFVGNSLTHTNGLPDVVAALAAQDGQPVHVEAVASPNASLEDHWASGGARGALEAGDWDAVVLQQGPSSLPESQDHLRAWATRWADEARANGATPALYMVWPAAARRSAFPDVVVSYTQAAEASGSVLLPAGAAWLEAWAGDPEAPLYGPDGFHPSPAGTYLAALVVYGGLTGVPVRDLPSAVALPDSQLSVPAALAARLREAAARVLATP